jgi:hypothetical protein
MHRRLISSNANGIYEFAKQLAYETLTSKCEIQEQWERAADGLNTITRRGEIGTEVPVFGLRPIR